MRGRLRWPDRLAVQLVLLAVAAAILPLAAFGTVAILRARKVALDQVAAGNAELARRAAGEVQAVFAGERGVLRSLVVWLADPRTRPREAMRAALRAHRIEFPATGLVEVWSAGGALVETSRDAAEPPPALPRGALEAARIASEWMGDVRIAPDLEPEVTLAEPLRYDGAVQGVVVTRVRLTEVWGAIAAIRVGERGFARLVAGDGTVLAHGDPREQAALLRRAAAGVPAGPVATDQLGTRRVRGASGEEVLAVGAPVPGLGWVVVIEQPTAEAFALAAGMTTSLVLLVVLVALLAGLGAVFVAARVGRPLSTLASRAARVAERLGAGQPPEFEEGGPAEVRALAAAMGAMGRDLVRLYDEIRDHERMALVSRLGAGLAHDLRSPLVAIETAAKLVAQRPDDPEVRAQFAALVEREFARVHRFIADLRRVGQREGAAGVPAIRVPVDLRELAERVLARARAMGLPRSLTLAVEADGAPRAIGDPDQIERVLDNLVSNAVNAMAGRSGEVRVRVAGEPDAVAIHVIDQGVGIAPERLDRLFKEFGSTRRGGLGIGLPLVRRIVEDLGGAVAVASQPGQGATFSVRLPRDVGDSGSVAHD